MEVPPPVPEGRMTVEAKDRREEDAEHQVPMRAAPPLPPPRMKPAPPPPPTKTVSSDATPPQDSIQSQPQMPAAPSQSSTLSEPSAAKIPLPEVNKEMLSLLLTRKEEYKAAAIKAKKSGDNETAVQMMRIMKVSQHSVINRKVEEKCMR